MRKRRYAKTVAPIAKPVDRRGQWDVFLSEYMSIYHVAARLWERGAYLDCATERAVRKNIERQARDGNVPAVRVLIGKDGEAEADPVYGIDRAVAEQWLLTGERPVIESAACVTRRMDEYVTIDELAEQLYALGEYPHLASLDKVRIAIQGSCIRQTMPSCHIYCGKSDEAQPLVTPVAIPREFAERWLTGLRSAKQLI